MRTASEFVLILQILKFYYEGGKFRISGYSLLKVIKIFFIVKIQKDLRESVKTCNVKVIYQNIKSKN